MSRQTIQIEGTYNPTLDIGVILVDTTNSPANITLPNILSSNADDIGYKLIIQDISENASNNNIVIHSSPNEEVNGASSVNISMNGGAMVFEPFANKYWVAYPLSLSSSGGERTGIIEVPLTLFQSGSNYYAKMGSGFETLLGDSSGFIITQNAGAQGDIIKSTSNVITRIGLIYYLQCITQTGNVRAFGSLFVGARATGGAVSPARSVNNYRLALPMEIGYAAPNTEIQSRISWNGLGTLTLNGATMLIEFIY